MYTKLQETSLEVMIRLSILDMWKMSIFSHFTCAVLMIENK